MPQPECGRGFGDSRRALCLPSQQTLRANSMSQPARNRNSSRARQPRLCRFSRMAGNPRFELLASKQNFFGVKPAKSDRSVHGRTPMFRYKSPASPGENGCGTVDPGFSPEPRTGKDGYASRLRSGGTAPPKPEIALNQREEISVCARGGRESNCEVQLFRAPHLGSSA